MQCCCQIFAFLVSAQGCSCWQQHSCWCLGCAVCPEGASTVVRRAPQDIAEQGAMLSILPQPCKWCLSFQACAWHRRTYRCTTEQNWSGHEHGREWGLRGQNSDQSSNGCFARRFGQTHLRAKVCSAEASFAGFGVVHVRLPLETRSAGSPRSRGKVIKSSSA